MTAPILTVEDLFVEVATPSGALPAVCGASLDVTPGKVTCLVGESGSGKSLTALAVVQLLPPGARIAGGRVTLEGRALTGLSERELQRVRGGAIGLVFQEPMSALDPVMRVGDQVAEAVRAHARVSRRDALARAEALFREVGIPEPRARLASYPHEMSGGMKQRVCVAMALAAEPKVLIADEPTTALDVTVQAQVLALIAGLCRDRGLGVLLITHDLGVVEEIADEVCVMYLGRVVERAAASDLLASPRHPYTQGLLRSVPRLGERRARLEAVPGAVPPLDEVPSGCRFRDRCALADDACAREDPALVLRGGRLVACIHAPDGSASAAAAASARGAA